MRAYVLVQVHKGEQELLKFVKKLPAVEEANIVYGEYDIVIKTSTKSLKELTNLVLNEIRKRFDVIRTSTLIVAESEGI